MGSFRADARIGGAHATRRYRHLSTRRHLDQGGPRQHGLRARSPRAAARSSRRRILLAFAAQRENSRRRQQMAAAAGALSPRAAGIDRTAKDGLQHSTRRLAARAAARLGGNPSVRTPAARGGAARRGAGSPMLAGPPERTAQPAISALERADVRGLARTVGLSRSDRTIHIADVKAAPPRSAHSSYCMIWV